MRMDTEKAPSEDGVRDKHDSVIEIACTPKWRRFNRDNILQITFTCLTFGVNIEHQAMNWEFSWDDHFPCQDPSGQNLCHDFVYISSGSWTSIFWLCASE